MRFVLVVVLDEYAEATDGCSSFIATARAEDAAVFAGTGGYTPLYM